MLSETKALFTGLLAELNIASARYESQPTHVNLRKYQNVIDKFNNQFGLNNIETIQKAANQLLGENQWQHLR